MVSLTLHEKKMHLTGAFPAEYYRVDSSHPRYDMPFHWHREWELITVAQGSVRFTVDGEEIIAGEHQILLIPGGGLHGGTPMEESVYECLVFDPEELFSGMKEIKKSLFPLLRFEKRPVTHYIPADCPEQCAAVMRAMAACRRMEKGAGGEQLIIVGAIAELFGLILRDGLCKAVRREEEASYARIAQLKTVLEYIEQNYGQPITLEKLASLAELNAGYFCQVFREVTHRTPIDYLVLYRLEQACTMLSSGNLTVTEISMRCGFNDSGYFARRFRAQYGLTPTEFRRNNSCGR